MTVVYELPVHLARISPRARSLLPAVLALLLAAALSATPTSIATGAPPTPRPSIVFIVTDDQRWDTLQYMPNVQSELVAEGVTFDNAFVTLSLCCPSRTTSLTGLYSHSTGVYKNNPPHGGFRSFDDSSTVATWLDPAYKTALVGKYLNNYRRYGYIPPGWDRWVGVIDTVDNTHYYDYQLSIDGVDRSFGTAPGDYATTVMANKAVQFIQDTKRPLFLWFAPVAPHYPAIPAQRDLHSLSDWVPPRPPSYNEADVSDKPLWLQAQPAVQPDPHYWDRFDHNQLRTLLSVDRSVGMIIDALQATGRLDNTLIVFTSDNGITWGEHRWYMKDTAYEEAIRVPLVVRYDPLVTSPRSDSHLIANIDNAPTMAEAAGVATPFVEGQSLLPLLSSSSGPWRDTFLLEHMQPRAKHDPLKAIPNFCGVRTTDYKYVSYADGERELYDLTADPFELQNQASNPSFASTEATLAAQTDAMCVPLPPAPTAGTTTAEP